MNDLQIALIAAGVAVVAGVWAYNKWQERGHRKLAERILQPGDDAQDVLRDETAPEHESAGWQHENNETEGREEPALRAEPVMPQTVQVARSFAAADSPWADGVADAVAQLDFADAVAAPTLWAAQSEWAGHISKPLHWLGLGESNWIVLTAHDAGRYARVLASLQLADRQGPVAESELEVFVSGVGAMATHLAGVVSLPDVEADLARGHALDEFCAAVDFQLTVHVAAAGSGAFAGTRLRGLVESAGMKLLDDGRFHAVDNDGNTLFTLANAGVEAFDADTLRSIAVRGVTFSLDVPNVAQGPRVFDAMVAAARNLAIALGGLLVDAQRAPLTDAMIAGIRARIQELQSRMTARQIEAGSPRARRLFS